MSAERTGYIGPIVVCQNGKIVEDRVVRACPNKECLEFGQTNRFIPSLLFCPQCGTKIEDVTVPRPARKINADNLAAEIGYALAYLPVDKWSFPNNIGDVDVWVNNRGSMSVSLRFEPCNDSIMFVPELGRTEREVAEFEEKCAEPLAALREAYGPENVTIKWGFLNWVY